MTPFQKWPNKKPPRRRQPAGPKERGKKTMSSHTVYIDEAGDLGFGNGTKWFVLTAVVVAKEDESSIRSNMNQIKSHLNVKEIHLRKIREFMKKAYIATELSAENFVYMNVLVDTTKFDTTKIPNPMIAYNFVCKYLLQRVAWYLAENGFSADVVLSSRGTSRDGELICYIKDKLFPYKANGIDATLFEKVTAKSSGTWDLLQLADVCATTMFNAYEPNSYGFCVPCFSLALKEHLYRRNKNIESYGVKFFTKEMRPDLFALRKLRICTKKERTSGATTTY